MENDKVNILIVNDNQGSLNAMEAVLAPLGQNIFMASSGAEALRLTLKNDFAVILMDVVMPEMDGYETAELIRKRDRSRFTPVIFVTALDKTTEGRARGYSLGAVDYLYSPVEPEILKSKVFVFIELHKKTQALLRSEELLTKQAKALEQKNRELEQNLHEIKTLRGLLPICSYCKKIRDDEGYWQQMEMYIRDHSDAEFSHGICPECEVKAMQDFEEFKKKNPVVRSQNETEKT